MGERVATSLGNSLFAKALSCAVSVVKANHVHDRGITSHVRKEISVSVTTNVPFWQIDLLPFCLTVKFEEMILPRLKSGILAGFC